MKTKIVWTNDECFSTGIFDLIFRLCLWILSILTYHSQIKLGIHILIITIPDWRVLSCLEYGNQRKYWYLVSI